MTGSGDIVEKELSDDDSRMICLSYLQQLASATATLCLQSNETRTVDSSLDDDGEVLVQEIAENLLQASKPSLLASPPAPALQSLPSQFDIRLLPEFFPQDDVYREYRDMTPKPSRIDFLRQVCRAMAPVSLDVGVRVGRTLVVSLLQRQTDDETTVAASAAAAAAFVLFATWLPVAPQLSSLVSDLFALKEFPCPFAISCCQDEELDVRFVLAEAAHRIYEHYGKQGDHKVMNQWWGWGSLFGMLTVRNNDTDVVMDDVDDSEEPNETRTMSSSDVVEGTRWHAARAIGYLLALRPAAFALYLEQLNLRERYVPWVTHPWFIDQEEDEAEFAYLRGELTLWGSYPRIQLPSSEQMRKVIPLHPALVHAGNGVVLIKTHAAHEMMVQSQSHNVADHRHRTETQHLILTPTTARNLSLLGAALSSDPAPPPILVCGPPGSGKSSLVREMARLCSPCDELLELHMDEETDSKTLIGSYTTTDVPGEFHWRPGALTQAVRAGRWVLMEDVDMVPREIQAALIQLLEDRQLPLGAGKVERCHPDFRLFGTCTTRPGGTDPKLAEGRRQRLSTSAIGGKKIVSPLLWRKVHAEPLTVSELRDISRALHPTLPSSVINTALNIFQVLDQSGRSEGSPPVESDSLAVAGSPLSLCPELMPTVSEKTFLDGYRIATGRQTSVRDFFKVLSRISHSVTFESGSAYTTESQRTLCMAETVDIFAASCPVREQRRTFVSKIAAPLWGITPNIALLYFEARAPSITPGRNYIEIGRAKIPGTGKAVDSHLEPDGTFAPTSYALRLMESIAVCIAENEATLLVGETGCGKTTLVQQLANKAGRQLIVQNLSLQTDSTDLLGGYRPLEIRHIARRVYLEFVDIFVSTFSRKQNADFLRYTSSIHEQGNWKKLSQCFQRAASLGLKRVQDRKKSGAIDENTLPGVEDWTTFNALARQFDRQRLACDSGLAFAFTEGALVDAIRSGKWVLLDEINLATSETLQRLCGLLDDSTGSVTLTERGDSEALKRHSDFRLFAAMNPATDAGKKDLPASIRSRFTELYVDELLDPIELRAVAARYLSGILSTDAPSVEQSATVSHVVDIYLECRDLADKDLVDAVGQKPRYTLRTLCRALKAARNLATQQGIALNRSLLEGFELCFEGTLDGESSKRVRRVLGKLVGQVKKGDMDHPARRPGGNAKKQTYVLVKPFWIKSGPVDPVDLSDERSSARPKFVLTPSVLSHLRRLARAVASGPWPVLLEGPTSSGKTSIVEYLGARCGHKVVRINNHEHTDIQEYTGAYSADENGSLSFRDGILVQALRKGHWVVLDELNLAPSEVLEALNRLLDDNRELYLAETNEVVTPHPNFRLFATQNPCGAYGGRKPLSRAFRNRFVEIYIGDIPAEEMITILEQRCDCPSTHSKILVQIMTKLRQRRSKNGVFLGKDGLITPRDLLRWAQRGASSKRELAQEGYMLLAERLRSEDEKSIVLEEIESRLKVKVNIQELYYGESSDARSMLENAQKEQCLSDSSVDLSRVAPTKSLLRLLTLVLRCVRQKEPVLLVGDTGCGKTTVVQLLSLMMQNQLNVVNCHASTETSDLIGGLRPVRGRDAIQRDILLRVLEFLELFPMGEMLAASSIPNFLVCRLSASGDQQTSMALPDDAVQVMVSLVKELWGHISGAVEPSRTNEESSSRSNKRVRLQEGYSVSSRVASRDRLKLECLALEIVELSRRFGSFFEWSDGPLVRAMRLGHMVLLDEMSLAEDAVLERLNSVLEPSRSIVLAEKGADCSNSDELDGRIVVGHQNFRIFATMNPGGDFGKRELSPALRSRFTEIFVPAVTETSDIAMVLGRSFMCGSVQEAGSLVKGMILEYVSWFNNDVCNRTSSPCANLALSLRDVLTWAGFVSDSYSSSAGLSKWEAYCHGACLMHLDGLGLGTGLSLDDASELKTLASLFLLKQVPEEHRGVCEIVFQPNIHREIVTGENFGIHPFTIATGPYPPPERRFRFEAPTPALNLLRVLRALQVSKPVLLEGSPGVGKTSLIAALAEASGHRLVRINLSEQTDISDLMGSDLPVPQDKSSSVAANDRAHVASFRWCDGVLLHAIKRGDWVLLDELNLASQAVLEGLNSCLDHRASVFIPELGETFHCPPSFKIFAAQNPLAQGGGRKGLPRSFLNRFTKVYVEALDTADLEEILVSRFPRLPVSFVKAVVKLNDIIHRDVVVNRNFGQAGAPWEFNLRDICRLCELIESGKDPITYKVVGEYARSVYLQRFRTKEDRACFCNRFYECFDTSILPDRALAFYVSDEQVVIGKTALSRLRPSISRSRTSNDFVISRSLLQPMETVAQCIKMSWPCLLVGPSASGKSALLDSLAELCNASIVKLSLTSASDVNELVGNFEQFDADLESRIILENIRMLHEKACTSLTHTGGNLKLLSRISELLCSIDETHEDEDGLLLKGSQLVDLFEVCFREFQKFGDQQARECITLLRRSLQNLQRSLNDHERQNQGSGHFRWVDGILVTAMIHGHWLHLENVNFCPSSVLDRLNPIMEKGGELLLTECSIGGNDMGSASGHRVVKQHPNFRVFLSMNAEFGEVSRAMRNRCVEIALIPPCDTTNIEEQRWPSSTLFTVDQLDLIGHAGLRSSFLGTGVLKFHNTELADSEARAIEPVTVKHLQQWSRSTKGFFSRGWKPVVAMNTSLQLSYELSESLSQSIVAQYFKAYRSAAHSSLLSCPSHVWDWSMYPLYSALEFKFRIVKLLSCVRSRPPSPDLFPAGRANLQLSEKASELMSEYGNICSLLPDDSEWFERTKAELLALALGHLAKANYNLLLNRLGGAFCALSQFLTLVGDIWRLNRSSHLRETLCLGRMAILLKEDQLSRRVKTQNMLLPGSEVKLSVIEVSLCVYEGRLDRSGISCHITPLVYPFFKAFDDWFDIIFKQAEDTDLLKRLLSQRDRMFQCLQECHYVSPEAKSFLGFQEAGLVVHWVWFKKRMAEVGNASAESLHRYGGRQWNKLCSIIDDVDRVLFNIAGDLSAPSDTVWKKGGHPQVPCEAHMWSSIENLRQLCYDCSLTTESRCGRNRRRPVSLQELLNLHHAVLFISEKEKADILGALCMAFWSCTSEMKDQKTSFYSFEETTRALKQQYEMRKEKFMTRAKEARLDQWINNAENLLDVERLERLREEKNGCSAFIESDTDFFEEGLLRFAQLQLSPVTEFWCINEEAQLLDILAETFLSLAVLSPQTKSLCNIAERLRGFVNFSISRTLWPVSDFRPYNTLYWALKGASLDASSLKHLLRCLLPRMIYSASQHIWFNSFNDLSCISHKLDIPSIWNEETITSADIEQGWMSAFFQTTGPSRLSHKVWTETTFRLFGSELASMFGVMIKNSLCTIENEKARIRQAKILVNSFASLRCESIIRPPFRIHFLLANSIEALRDTFPRGVAEQILAVVASPDNLENTDELCLFELMNTSNFPALKECRSCVIKPLIHHLKASGRSKESAALSWVYIGLLQMHLVVPNIPLDPGLKPIVKMEEWDRYLVEIRTKLAALRLASGYETGDFYPDSEMARSLLCEGKVAMEKQSKQYKKRVRRVSSALPFHVLFRETRQFLGYTSNKDGIQSLLELIIGASTRPNAADEARHKEFGWQETSASFCSRLMEKFAPYEDVVIPFINAVQDVKRGVRLLAQLHLGTLSETEQQAAHAMTSLLAFPMGKISGDVPCPASASENTVTCQDTKVQDLRRCSLSVSLANLSRIVLLKHVNRGVLDSDSFILCHTTFLSLANAWAEGQDSEAGNRVETDRDILEGAYREQFPNHSREFDETLRDIEENHEELQVDQCNKDEKACFRDISLSEDQVSSICLLHRNIFSGCLAEAEDHCRFMAFSLSYCAAYLIGQARPWSTKDAAEDENMGGHLMSLASQPSFSARSQNMFDPDEPIDFHRDPNPGEVRKASIPLRKLLSRTSQLVSAFPGNEILLAVGRVVDKVRKLPLASTSVGKAMAGLELVLRKAQEWEQHASDRVKLGTALENISSLVATWRKLELKSWVQLLEMREHRCRKRARRHWIRLYNLLHVQSGSGDTNSGSASLPPDACPNWVWKGLRQSIGQFCIPEMKILDETGLGDLMKALDTFLLTSSIGEFEERLLQMKAFVNQYYQRLGLQGQRRSGDLEVSRALRSLFSYYEQFLPSILARKADLRSPIAARLMNEVKLAKWDEQSYYALIETTERNHRKLMKILHEYDEGLETGVASLIEADLCAGVRSDSSSRDNPCTSIPSFDAFFPLFINAPIDGNGITVNVLDQRFAVVDKKWASMVNPDLSCDKYIQDMEHYHRKMLSFLQRDTIITTWSNVGEARAASLCTAIFERIDSLRKPKTSKQMKERALVDLFRSLRKDGYVTTKWSIPGEVRQMLHIFQLPRPEVSTAIVSESDQRWLQDGEKYFLKALAEVRLLRSETSMLGSRYMNQREMQIMESIGDHSLLVLSQQRCTLAKVFAEVDVIHGAVLCLSTLEESLPVGQTTIALSVTEFNSRILLSIENLKQALLLMKKTTPLLDCSAKATKMRDSIDVVENCLNLLRSYNTINVSHVASETDLRTVSKTKTMLDDIADKIQVVQADCQTAGCLPSTVLDVCLSHIKRASEHASACVEQKISPAVHVPGIEASDVLDVASWTLQASLISVQGVCKQIKTEKRPLKVSKTTDEAVPQKEMSLLECHASASGELASLQLRGLGDACSRLCGALRKLHESDRVPKIERDFCLAVAKNVGLVVREVLGLTARRIHDYLLLFRQTAKLNYICLRIFRVLISKGFCADSVSDDDNTGKDGAGGMKFEDEQDGTGMGDGAGKQDVSDQLESEEQIAGLKRDGGDEHEQTEAESKQLNEEEANQGIEMEEDIEGEIFDLPQTNPDIDGDNSEDEELDREMGGGSDPHETVVDEKVWDPAEEDEENDQTSASEKFEKDSSMKGETLQNELLTRDDGDDKHAAEEARDDGAAAGEAEAEDEDETANFDNGKESRINEDSAVNYEEQHDGVEIRDEELAEDEDEEMQLNEDMEFAEENDEVENQSEGMEGNSHIADDEKKMENGDLPPDEACTESELLDRDQDASTESLPTHSYQEGVDDQTDASIKPEVSDSDSDEIQVESTRKEEATKETMGVAAQKGKNSVAESMDEDDGGDEMDRQGDNKTPGNTEEADASNPSRGSADGGEDGRGSDGSGHSENRQEPVDAPNPFRNPGDATKFWHRKLEVVDNSDSAGAEEKDAGINSEDDPKDSTGQFEYSRINEPDSTQVLGEVSMEETVQLDQSREIKETPASDDTMGKTDQNEFTEQNTSKSQISGRRNKRDWSEKLNAEDNQDEEVLGVDQMAVDDESREVPMEEDAHAPLKNLVVSDLAQLDIRPDEESTRAENLTIDGIVEEEQTRVVSDIEAADARTRWTKIQGETQHLARRLSEKLRLVMEPLVATKLRGDYRTGKRINMKRVIGYIASGYRKDKIWLRRTKPAKRNYRILLAVDDSESMQKGQTGEMALRAMATLAVGMSQLEVGELGIASFGEEMRLLHPFHQPFTSEDGINIVHSFPFDEKRTRTALCVESALSALETIGEHASLQLLFLISDGRIERDSRSTLRRLIREMVERNILLVMIIVEGEGGGIKKDSIVHMKEVSFENGKPKVKQFIEDYPFPYYIVMDDIQSLPEVLGDALRQWFEMIAQLQSSRS